MSDVDFLTGLTIRDIYSESFKKTARRVLKNFIEMSEKIKQLKRIIETEKQLNRNKIELDDKQIIKFIDLECLKEELEIELETSLLFHELVVQERDLERVKVNRLEEENAELKAPTIIDHEITEIIPSGSDRPEWANTAIIEGQFFSAAILKVKSLEEEMETLKEECDGYKMGADAEARQVDEQFKIITKLREEMDTLKEHCRNVVGYHLSE